MKSKLLSAVFDFSGLNLARIILFFKIDCFDQMRKSRYSFHNLFECFILYQSFYFEFLIAKSNAFKY